MDVIRGIAKIFEDDPEHRVEIKVHEFGISVDIILDTEGEYSEGFVIPVEYCEIEEFAYVNHRRYVELCKPNDYGIDSSEIRKICRLMNYMESHKKDIHELCTMLGKNNGGKEK